ncbi:hypothetical protein V5799_011501 [Amblyomma americanum]|uniref:Uncharacterized protein n=1 Tax=Amblyomma americanum TaxID=6943 RepID=A0AAQ4EGW7_AMBAM
MVAQDMKELRSLLESVSPDDLLCIADADIPRLPDLCTLPLSTVASKIYEAVNNVRTVEKRLNCIAQIRCRLMHRHTIQGWKFYRQDFPRSKELFDMMLIDMEVCLRLVPTDTSVYTYSWTTLDDRFYGCFLTKASSERCVKWDAVHVIFWMTQPLMATQTANESIEKRLSEVVRSTLGGNAVCIHVNANGNLEEGARNAIDSLRLAAAQREKNLRDQDLAASAATGDCSRR